MTPLDVPSFYAECQHDLINFCLNCFLDYGKGKIVADSTKVGQGLRENNMGLYS